MSDENNTVVASETKTGISTSTVNGNETISSEIDTVTASNSKTAIETVAVTVNGTDTENNSTAGNHSTVNGIETVNATEGVNATEAETDSTANTESISKPVTSIHTDTKIEEKPSKQCGDSFDTFTSSQGQLLVGEHKFTIRTLKMDGATMVFISATESESLDEMAVAMKMPQDGQIIGTTILGTESTTDSQRMAEKLTKRFGRQFFVSFNVQVDRMTGPLLEKEFSEYVKNHVEEFA